MFIFDGHCDSFLDVIREKRHLYEVNQGGHLDFSRMKSAGIKIQTFALFIESIYKPHNALRRSLQQIARFYQEMNLVNDIFQIIVTKKDLTDVLSSNSKMGAILAIEGGEGIDGDLDILYILYRLGIRSIGITWNQRNALADGVNEAESRGGLTSIGKKVILEMNKLGMVVDLAHISESGFWDTINLTEKPLIVSHANVYNLFKHKRNLNDKQIKAIKDNKGVIGITFAPEFLGENASIDTVIEHIDYCCQLMGTADHIGIGSDFDGTDPLATGLEDVTKVPNIINKLVKVGYKYTDIEKIMGGNFIRVYENNLK